ncbi:16S rRNA (adenine(1518)-N(6)/adenine(1519)-N(6))-dimethyltransferase RsmA [Croceiramulus getboli]|nr:16S rRNA (adenine(1518)-N(6)/adenine(1519)-N(6))-dimethyltransferase RsmA [Flavobacteriaceae bacterium YJPT1-3]
MGKSKKKGKPWETDPANADPVRAKKHLGQHFLKDEGIAQRIADTLSLDGYSHVLEIGPGTGVLTKYLLLKDIHLVAMDLDRESIAYLREEFPLAHPKITQSHRFQILEADFLNYDLSSLFDDHPFAITGNFPYNISTQIVFKMLEWRHRIPEFTGMFQREVAQRICEKEGSKAYGILSVLVGAFYEASYLFTVHPQVFSPPPKVQSGVLRLRRKNNWEDVGCDPKMLFRVVKMAFQQRRKTLRNSLKQLDLSDAFRESEILNKRPEQLPVSQFIALTASIEQDLQAT